MAEQVEELEVPYILPNGVPLSALKQDEFQVYMYGFTAAEMQQVMTAARQIQGMIQQLTVFRGKVKGDARKAKIIPADASAERRKKADEDLQNMYDKYNAAQELNEELKTTVFTKVGDTVKFPNILAMAKKVNAIVA